MQQVEQLVLVGIFDIRQLTRGVNELELEFIFSCKQVVVDCVEGIFLKLTQCRCVDREVILMAQHHYPRLPLVYRTPHHIHGE